MSKAYLIDVASQQTSEVEYDGLEDMHKLLGGYIEVAGRWPSGDVLFVDEEGLLKRAPGFFMVAGLREDQPLAGNGLVVGPEHYEGTVDDGRYLGTHPPRISLAELTARVRFLTVDQARAWGKANASEPAVTSHFLDGGGVHSEVLARFGTLFEQATRPPTEPRYWMHETSGVLVPVMQAYLTGAELSGEQAATMRSYLRQWIMADVWKGPEIDLLRVGVDALATTELIRAWIGAAIEAGVDPL